MTDKPYHEMTDDELTEALKTWGANVDNATGFPSAYFAAKQCAAIVSAAERRGLALVNNWPIVRG